MKVAQVFPALNTLVFISFSCLLLASCSENNASPNAQHAPYVHVADINEVAQQSNYTVLREYVGNIAAKQQSQLSFEFAGRVVSTSKDSGDIVKQGEVLAQQDTELLNIKAEEINALLAQVDAQLSLNRANLTRLNELKAKDYASQQKLDELTAQLTILNANKQGLTASLKALNYQIDKATLRAPYAGIIDKRFVSQGNLVAGGTPTFTLVQQNQQQISFGIPAEVAETLAVNQQLPVTINNQSHQAVIKAIGQQVNAITRTVSLRLELTNKVAINNASGAIARIAIEQQVNKSGFWVPLTALTDGIRGLWNIYIVTPDNDVFKIEAHTVEVIHTTKSHAYIAGFPADQLTLITSGLHRYVPGQLVKPATIANSNTSIEVNSAGQGAK